MGTNYYAETSVHGVPVRLHIGKWSGGWKFLFAEYDNLRTKVDWFKWLDRPGVTIVDEYEAPITIERFTWLVQDCQHADNWDYRNAPTRIYGSSMFERERHERLDQDGYRFSKGDPEGWS